MVEQVAEGPAPAQEARTFRLSSRRAAESVRFFGGGSRRASISSLSSASSSALSTPSITR